MAELEITLKLELDEIQALRFLVKNTEIFIDHINKRPFLTEKGWHSLADAQEKSLKDLREVIHQLELLHAL